MKFNYALPLAAAWLFVCGFAQAHGPQIQLTGDTGQIVTRRVIPDEPYSPLQPETRIFVIPVKEISGIWFVKPPTASSSGPGIAMGVGYDADPNSHPFQSGDYTVKFADGLLAWNGAAFVDPNDTQLRITKGTSSIDTTDSGPFASLTWSVIVDEEDAHSGLSYRFLGDGSSPTSALDDGIYLLTLQLTHGTLTDSEPFYYVLPKGESLTTAVSAANSLASLHGISASEIQVVPEPVTVALLLGGMATVLWRRRP